MKGSRLEFSKSNMSIRANDDKMRKLKHEIEKQEVNDTSIAKIFIAVLALSAIFVGVYIQLAKNISENLRESSSAQEVGNYPNSLGTLGDTLVVADNLDAGYLDHVIDALFKFGHKLSFSGSLTPHKLADLQQYSLIWTHDYPFQVINKSKPLQRINHFPGTGFITNKMTLSTTPRVPHILKAFRIPAEKERFVQYTKQNPKKMWIQKSSSHRGISIESAETVRLDLDDTLVQEYMSNPLLIDGKKFDIGIYVVLTSVEPLRVYIYESEALLRFCANSYLDKATQQFNSSNIDSFVVGDDYTPMWLMPSLLRYYIGTNLSMKRTLDAYLKSIGLDGGKIWKQIDETIKNVYKIKEHHLARMSQMFQESNNYNQTSAQGSLNQFFEMVRFDFIVDENLNVFLMEANMSPNLSSRHFPPNRLIYEQVLNSYFSLVGLGQYAKEQLSNLPIHYMDGHSDMPVTKLAPKQLSAYNAERYGLENIISDKELSVYEDLCISDECHMDCHKIDCKICYFCLSNDDKLHLRRAIFEQNSRWNFKRILPSTQDDDLHLQLTHPETKQQNIDSNYIHVQWFRGKCHSDERFCSY